MRRGSPHPSPRPPGEGAKREPWHDTATRYLGTIHDFVMLNAITDTPAARAAIAQANAALRRVFTK